MAQVLLFERNSYRAYGSYFSGNHLFSQSKYGLLLRLYEHRQVTKGADGGICKSAHLWLIEYI